jgi:hypothetical protein
MRAGQRAPRWLPKVSRVSGPSLALRDGDGNLRAATHFLYGTPCMVTCVYARAPPAICTKIYRLPRFIFIHLNRASIIDSLFRVSVSTFNYEFHTRSCHFRLSVCAFRFRVRIFFLSKYTWRRRRRGSKFLVCGSRSSDGKYTARCSPSRALCVSLCNYFKLGAIARKRQQFCDIERTRERR